MVLSPLLGLVIAIGAVEAERPKLAVVLVFDQMRGDYLDRWQHLFRPDGFRRLCTDGAWFANAHYPYGITVTAAGHSTISTGLTPHRHGIVGNDWLDPATRRTVYCVASDRWMGRVWRTEPLPNYSLTRASAGPDLLLAPTLGDRLKEAVGDRCKVISMSAKDRSAVLMGGRRTDACYWLDRNTGLFETSTYYGETVHPWVRDMNDRRPADRWLGESWDRSRSDVDYEREAGPDDVVGEGDGVKQGRTFPHAFPTEPPSDYYEAVATSPMANVLLVELAEAAIQAERLGQHEQPDLLLVSFSSNDLVGHQWGPDSQEVLDITLRADELVARLLNTLDKHVGAGNYVVAVSSDHGVSDLPEKIHAQGGSAGRLDAGQLVKMADAHLNAEFHPPADRRWIDGVANYWVGVSPPVIKELNLDPETVRQALARWLETQEGIAKAWTRAELLDPSQDQDPIVVAYRKSFHPDRSGDVLVLPKPNFFFGSGLVGTSHGTPYPYDTHVPVILYGAGITGGRRDDRVSPTVIVPVLASQLGMPLESDEFDAVPATLSE